jgi:hypothetical protein
MLGLLARWGSTGQSPNTRFVRDRADDQLLEKVGGLRVGRLIEVP